MMIRKLAPFAALAGLVLVHPALAGALPPQAEKEIVQAAHRGEPLGARDLIAKHAAGDIQAATDGWIAALAGADTGLPRAARTLAKLSEEASHAAVGFAPRDPAAAVQIARAVAKRSGPWSGEMAASAAKVAADLSRVGKAVMRQDANAAAELTLIGVQMAGRAGAVGAPAAEIVANAQTVADSLRSVNPQTAMQITMQLRNSKLRR